MPAMPAPILVPVIGGIILPKLHWSWSFFVNVPIGVVALALGWRLLPHTDSGEAGPLDLVGLALLPAGGAALLFRLSQNRSGAGPATPVGLRPRLARAPPPAPLFAPPRPAPRPRPHARL